MTSVNLTEAKNNLSRYVRKAAGGETILITVHGRVMAELRTPAVPAAPDRPKREWTNEEWAEFLETAQGVRAGSNVVETMLFDAPPRASSGAPTSEQVIEERRER